MKSIKILKKNLKGIIKDKKVTLSAMAESAGISEDTLRSMVYGNAKDAKLSTVVKIADSLRCTLDELIGRNIYTKKEKDIMDQIKTLPRETLNLIDKLVKFEKESLLNNSKTNKEFVTMFILNGCMKDGMYYDGASIELLDISEYPQVLKRDVSVAVKVLSNQLEPICHMNDVILLTAKKPEYDDIVIYVDKAERVYIRKYTILGLEPLTNTGDIIFAKEAKDYTPIGVILKRIRLFNIEYYR